MSTTTVLRCDRCGATATHTANPAEPDSIVAARCEHCARQEGTERIGEQYAGLKALGFAVQLLRHADMTPDTIRQAVEHLLHPDARPDLASHPVPNRLEVNRDAIGDSYPDGDQPWMEWYSVLPSGGAA